MYKLKVNGQTVELDVDGDTPLLWALRDTLGLTGTKFGCGQAYCGACTIHLDGKATRSCVLAVSAAAGHDITTIEGLSPDGNHPLQVAWREENVPQCGYCQAGQIMSAAALLATRTNPSDADIDANLPNICRCGTYNRVRRGVHRAVALNKRGKA